MPTPKPLVAPPLVSGFTATNLGKGSLTLSWQSRAGVAKYRVTLLVGVGRWQTVNDSPTGTSYTAWGLACGKRYHYTYRHHHADRRDHHARADAWRIVRC